MSAIAYALSLFPDGDDWLTVDALVLTITLYRGLPEDAQESDRLLMRDRYDDLSERLADAVRRLDDAQRSDAALNAAMDAATVPEVWGLTPVTVFRRGMTTALARAPQWIDDEVREIVLRAARLASKGRSARSGEWSARRTGRPPTPPKQIEYALRLRSQGRTHKEIARMMNDEFRTEDTQPEYTKESVRKMIKAHSPAGEKKADNSRA